MRRIVRTLAVAAAALSVLLLLGFRRDRPAAEVEARWATPPSRFLVVDGLRVHYRDRGVGPAIVLLHGAGSSLFAWEGWSEALAGDHRVIALDLPGQGLTGPDPRHRYRAGEMAEFVDAFVRQLGVARFVLAGHSMGGGVAWRYALAHPDKLDALVLVDAGGYPRDRPPPLGLRLQGAPIIGRITRFVTPRFLVARSLRDAYGDPARVDETLVDRYDDLLLRDGNREAARERFSLALDPDAARRVREVRAPTLILWGSRDHWIPPHDAERFHADIAGSTVVILDGPGHLPMEEAPAASLAALRAFLVRLPIKQTNKTQ
jgi:pimeloyl-ACP methyl ester carboxylesterase